jgi:hypothetical protein
MLSFWKVIGRARVRLSEPTAPDRPGPATSAPAHLAGTAMRSLLDLDRPDDALAFHEQVLDLGPANVRTRALHTALTATAHARAGQLDQAAHLAMQSLRIARRIRSRRVTARLAMLARVLTPHRAVPEVVAFLEQLPPKIGQAPEGNRHQG